MAVDPVPWAITGSQMDTFVMREFANIATRDAEGIQLPGNCKVTASGTNVSIAAGGLTLRNKQAAGQSYVGRVSSSTLQPIPASGGTAQQHLIVMTVRDNDFSPWQPWPAGTPTNTILFGPYFYPERLAATLTTTRADQLVSYTSYALARVDMPAGQSIVQDSYITDLRALALPRSGVARAVQQGPGLYPTNHDALLTSQTTYRTWPTNTLGVTIPSWATHCIGSIRLNVVRANGTGADADVRVNIGGLVGNSSPFDYNGNTGVGTDYWEGIPFEAFCDIDVRSLQGQTVVVQPQARRVGVTTGSMFVDSRAQVVFDLLFVERAV